MNKKTMTLTWLLAPLLAGLAAQTSTASAATCKKTSETWNSTIDTSSGGSGCTSNSRATSLGTGSGQVNQTINVNLIKGTHAFVRSWDLLGFAMANCQPIDTTRNGVAVTLTEGCLGGKRREVNVIY